MGLRLSDRRVEVRHLVNVLAGDDRAQGHGIDGLKIQRLWKLLSYGVGKPWIADAGIEEDNERLAGSVSCSSRLALIACKVSAPASFFDQDAPWAQ